MDFPEIYQKITTQELVDFIRGTVREENCAISVIYPIAEKEK